jgi:small GTP-binding protein
MDLRGYEQAKFELAEVLQSAGALLGSESDYALQDRLRNLFVRLAEDRFNLVMVGRFNRGKSSLMNAILGMDRLPTGIVPLTSVITTVSYGTTEQVTLKYQERRLDSEIKLEELSEYITQRGNPGNSRGIATANIQLPSEILRRGFYFVDTPGLGSVIVENTLTTQAYLPETDALLLVTSFESPLSEEELNFFRAASGSGLPIFVVVNKQDLVTEAERDEAMAFVRAHLRELFGETAPETFSVSARDGLAAKRCKDASLLDASGLPALEARLTTFLLEQKRAAFLAGMCSRIADLVRDVPLFDGNAGLRERAQALTEKYCAGRQGTITPFASGSIAPTFSRSQLRSCQICADVEAATFDFLARYQYELSTDRDSQAEFARRSGFCCFHTWEYQGLASPYGTCTGYPPLLERLAVALRAAAASSQGDLQTSIEDLLPTHAKCVVCALRDEAEARALAELADRLRRDVTNTLEKLSALCLPHLAALAKAVDQIDIVRALAEHHAATFERVAEDMRRFTLKHSAARRQLETKEDETSAQRALLLLVGHHNVNFAVGTVPCTHKQEPHDVATGQRHRRRT